MKSILQPEKKCYMCGTLQNLANHHVFFGTGNRKVSDKNGFTVWLCHYHHNMSDYSVHFSHDLDLMIKKHCQAKYEETHSRDDFMALIGRNYL